MKYPQLPNPFEDAARDLVPKSSPAPFLSSLNSGESEPVVMLACGAGETKPKRGRPKKGEKREKK